MNPGLVVKLRPAGPWRIGPDSGARNRVDAIYHSDSLYSAVTSAMSRMGWLSAWLDATSRSQTPAVCFSSCFPFLEDIGFVVPPRTIWPPTSPAAMSARVRWKSARFIPLSVVESILSGKKLNENQWSVDGASGCLVPAGKPGPFRTSVRWNAAVDRLSGASERHATACIEFREGCGLWTVAGFHDEAARAEWLERVKAAFRLLADTGFGGERSRGWGRAETPEFVEGTLPGLIIEYRRKEASAAPPIEEPPVEEPPPAEEPSPAPPIEEPPVEEPPVTEPSPTEEPGPKPEPPMEAQAAAAETSPAAVPGPASEVAAPETAPVAEPALEVDAPPAEAESAPAAEAALVPRPLDSVIPQTRSLTLGARMGATTVGEGLRPTAQHHTVGDLAPEAVAPAESASEAEGTPPAAAESSATTAVEAVAPASETAAELAFEAEGAPPAAAESSATTAVEAVAPETAPVADPAEAALSDAPTAAVVRAPDRTEPMRVAPEREASPAVPAFSVHLQAHWLLSLFTPAADDAVDWGRGSYTVLARGGRIDSPSGSGELKKQIQMVTEGSVLFSDGVPLGAAPDVAPDGFAHPVFRAGFALAIPLPEVH